MKRHFRQTLLFILFAQASCAALDRPLANIGEIFQGNTKKDIVDYGLEEKNAYRKFLQEKKIEEKEKEEQILDVMEKDKTVVN